MYRKVPPNSLLSRLDASIPHSRTLKLRRAISLTGLAKLPAAEIIHLRTLLNLAKRDPGDRQYVQYFLDKMDKIQPWLKRGIRVELTESELPPTPKGTKHPRSKSTTPPSKTNRDLVDNPRAKNDTPNSDFRKSAPQAQFLRWEFFSNSGSDPKKRGKASESLSYFLVPEHLVRHLGDSSSSKLMSLFKVEKEGKTYYRFPVNGEDTRYRHELADFLRAQGEDPDLYCGEELIAHKTASRSTFVAAGDIDDPCTQGVSVKVSTNHTGGRWQDKKLTGHKAIQSQLAEALVRKVSKLAPWEHLILLTEPEALIVGNPDNRMSVILRDYRVVFNSGNYLLPAFSALDETQGREIASVNGSDNPAEFWENHLIIPLAKAMAEFAARTSFSLESAHSQQFLIELSPKGLPTGKIALRDFDGSFALKGFYQEPTPFNSRFVQDHKTYHKMRNSLGVHLGLFHGTKRPSWVSKADLNRWLKTYFETFETTFMAYTGLTRKDMPATKPPQTTSLFGVHDLLTEYYSKTYSTKSSGWRRWFDSVRTLTTDIQIDPALDWEQSLCP